MVINGQYMEYRKASLTVRVKFSRVACYIFQMSARRSLQWDEQLK